MKGCSIVTVFFEVKGYRILRPYCTLSFRFELMKLSFSFRKDDWIDDKKSLLNCSYLRMKYGSINLDIWATFYTRRFALVLWYLFLDQNLNPSFREWWFIPHLRVLYTTAKAECSEIGTGLFQCACINIKNSATFTNKIDLCSFSCFFPLFL